MTEVKPSAEFSSPPATPTSGLAASTNPMLRDVDLRNIYALLIKGDDGLARRKDLGELHKRLVTMFTTLKQGLSEENLAKAADDRAHIAQRLDQMERSVNSMEGALRIELEPMLRGMVKDAIVVQRAQRTARPIRYMISAIVIFVAVALGSFFSAEISNAAKLFLPESVFSDDTLSQTPSLIGGIGRSANLVG